MAMLQVLHHNQNVLPLPLRLLLLLLLLPLLLLLLLLLLQIDMQSRAPNSQNGDWLHYDIPMSEFNCPDQVST